MITLKHIERLRTGRMYDRLFRERITNRPESALPLELELSTESRLVPAAALAAIRLVELNQSHLPLQGKLIRALIATQESDGGWGDPLMTALALRALLSDRGNGDAIDHAMQYLAMLQRPEGLWPKVPLRRMPADPYVSAFLLYQLGEHSRFRQAVRFFDAVDWFEANESTLDRETRMLWDRASLRCRLTRSSNHEALLWS